MPSRLTVDYLKSLLRKNAVVSLLGNGVSMLLGLLTFILLARWLTKSDFGEWSLLLTSYILFDTVRTGLVLNALIQQASHCENDDELRNWAGAAWQVGSLFTILCGSLLVVSVLISRWVVGPLMDVDSLLWLLLVGVISLPLSVASWLLQTKSRFGALQWSKLIHPLIFLVLLSLAYLNNALSIKAVGLAYLLAMVVSSLVSITTGWAFMSSYFTGTALERQPLLNYGKYSIGALLCSNLLRSSDIYLIRIFLGTDAVALYSIPQRLIQLLEVPIRSIVVTSIPEMVKLHRTNQPERLADFFRKNAGGLWIALLPVSLFCIIFAEPLVTALGGSQYRDATVIFRIFMVYSALIPLDRYVGVLLDSIGVPKANMTKIFIMLVINILGDLIALQIFHSVTAVAFVSIFTFGTGVVLGFSMIGKRLPITGWQVVRAGHKGLFLLYAKFARS
ncbi:lipopolysaccharide biosynthesis protein [Spirosoma litoris]